MEMTPIRTVTTVTSREFSQEAGRAKKRALTGPVFITDRGQRTHVLLSIDAYQELESRGMSVAESLAQTGPDGDFEFNPTRLTDNMFRPVNFD